MHDGCGARQYYIHLSNKTRTKNDRANDSKVKRTGNSNPFYSPGSFVQQKVKSQSVGINLRTCAGANSKGMVRKYEEKIGMQILMAIGL